jgi:nucleotide-binding universal stress UspA family protein
MSSTRPTPAPPAFTDAVRSDWLAGRVVVLGDDPRQEASPPARVALALAERRGARPHVVRVYDTRALPVPSVLPGLIAAAEALIGDAPRHAEEREVRELMRRRVGAAVAWPVHASVGVPAGAIVRTAAHLDAALVVLGLRRHARVDRLTRDETTLHVMRGAHCPVLGVAPGLEGLARCAVVGVDLSPASRVAAARALTLLRPGGTLLLVHVDQDRARDAWEPGDLHADVGAALDALATDLAAPANVAVHRVRRTAHSYACVADALRDVAGRAGAELLAVGSRRYDWLDRALAGSVATDLARAGGRSLLVVPPPPGAPPAPRNA